MRATTLLILPMLAIPWSADATQTTITPDPKINYPRLAPNLPGQVLPPVYKRQDRFRNAGSVYPQPRTRPTGSKLPQPSWKKTKPKINLDAIKEPEPKEVPKAVDPEAERKKQITKLEWAIEGALNSRAVDQEKTAAKLLTECADKVDLLREIEAGSENEALRPVAQAVADEIDARKRTQEIFKEAKSELIDDDWDTIKRICRARTRAAVEDSFQIDSESISPAAGELIQETLLGAEDGFVDTPLGRVLFTKRQGLLPVEDDLGVKDRQKIFQAMWSAVGLKGKAPTKPVEANEPADEKNGEPAE